MLIKCNQSCMMYNINHVFDVTELLEFTFDMCFYHYHNWKAWDKNFLGLAEYFVTRINSIVALENVGLASV